jgi:hypothetical protein
MASTFEVRADGLDGSHRANETSASAWSIERSDRSTDLQSLVMLSVTSEGPMR